ncbi:hypothetical protein NF27_CG00940 [Candidatus Jidaibacter acanthamoeba]|uniref:Uncharacterized protein n=1 Tax=Candidatus Jidaibacter acanthamoebae TaxID=86105 RepID=A0A0C1QK36_9RICK|nr:hypothetical protein [Candidatus Jidaibacter acanthamoeba]KIE05914.1 hypothetical protein NF27_CG00940 [Candidatus Jidaibacter acanthamoeba]
MLVSLKNFPLNKTTFYFWIILLSLGPNYAYAKAWPQAKDDVYTAQKVILNVATLSSTTEQIDLSNQLKINIKTKEKILENYVEYGLKNNFTLEAKLNISDIRDTIKLEVDSQNKKYEKKFALSYQKMSTKFGLNKKFFNSGDEVASVFAMVNPGEYIISNMGDRFNTKNWHITTGIAYGRSFYLNETFKNNYQEVSIESKYHPRQKSIETDLVIKFGFKANDTWTFTAASYNTFNNLNYQLKPYLNNSDYLLENLDILQKYKNFYNSRIKKFLTYTESKNINKIQLGVACLISKKKEIQFDLFIDPFNGKNNNNSSLVVSFNQNF